MMKIAALATLAAAAQANQYITDLSAMEYELLAAELNEWETSDAGVEALEHGFYNTALDQTEKLQRLLDTKTSIAYQSTVNPEANFGLTPFSMMTSEEFAAYVASGYAGETRMFRGEPEEMPEDFVPAQSKDWSQSGCLSPIQQQGNCGSCWAFSAVAASENAACQINGSFVKYGEQSVVSCSTNGGSMGCKGGFPTAAMTWIAQNGLCTAAEDPYQSGSSGQTGSCRSSCSKQKLPISMGRDLGAGDSSLMNGLNKQVVGVVVCAGNDTWKNYKGGVVSSCPSCRGDHAVVASAYDSQSFTIKNSWGTSWGESGYMRLKRGGGSSGTCLVTSGPAVPVMNGGPRPSPTRPGPTPTRPGPTPRPTPPSPGGCGGCTNCYYAPGKACFVGWNSAQCNQAGFKWCGM